MTAVTDITGRYTVPPPDDTDWNWADEAIDAWVSAALAAGYAPTVVSYDVPDVNNDAAIVEIDGARYLLTVHDDGGRDRRVTATPVPAVPGVVTAAQIRVVATTGQPHDSGRVRITRDDILALTADHPDMWADPDSYVLTDAGAALIADDINQRWRGHDANA